MHQVSHGIVVPTAVLLSLLATLMFGQLGVALAWVLRRHTMASVRNLYLAAAAAVLGCGLCVLARAWSGCW